MTTLNSIISKVKAEKTGRAIEEAIEQIMAVYDDLSKENNIRINDNSGEGIFFSSNRDCFYDNGHSVFIGKNKQDEKGEEAFSRAIFNGQNLMINKMITPIIGYEAPLLRKQKKQDGLVCKCDLIAFADNTIFAVEYKKNWGSSTDIQYGLVEGLLYGTILSRHLREFGEQVREQIITVAKKHNRPISLSEKKMCASFLLCAPANYFACPLKSKESQNVTVEMEKLIKEYLSKTNSQLTFGGYVVYGNDDSDLQYTTVKHGNKEVYVPIIASELKPKVQFATNITDIWDKL